MILDPRDGDILLIFERCELFEWLEKDTSWLSVIFNTNIWTQKDDVRRIREYYKESEDIDGTLRQLPRYMVAEKAIVSYKSFSSMYNLLISLCVPSIKIYFL